MTTPADRDRLEVFPGADGQAYWRRRAANGQIVASGAEGFTRDTDAVRAAYRANPDLDPNNDPEINGDKP